MGREVRISHGEYTNMLSITDVTYKLTWSYQSVSNEGKCRWVKDWPTRDCRTAHSMEVKLTIGCNVIRDQALPNSRKHMPLSGYNFSSYFMLFENDKLSPVLCPGSSLALVSVTEDFSSWNSKRVSVQKNTCTLSFLGFKYHILAVLYSWTLERISVSSQYIRPMSITSLHMVI